MSPEHRRIIQARMKFWAWGIAGLAILLLAAIGFFFIKLHDPTVAARGEWIPLALLGALWAWWLRNALPQWWRARQDLKAGATSTITGTIHYDIRSSIGLIPVMKYRLRVGNERLEVQQEQLFALQTGQPYRIEVAPRSRVFLEATPLVESPSLPSSLSDRSITAVPAFVDPINEREAELLALLAKGYSNREIALHLSLSVNTIKMYTSQLYQKMGVKRRTEAVARAREWGWLP